MPPDEPTEEERQEELPEDNQTPFQPADPTDSNDHLDDTHPQTDTNIQKEELYDEGVAGAAEVSEPSDSAVVDFTPPTNEDEEKKNP